MKSFKTTLSVFLFATVASTAFAGNGDVESAAAPGSGHGEKVVCEALCASGGPFKKGLVNKLVYAENEDAVAAFSTIEQQCQRLSQAANTSAELRVVGKYEEASIEKNCFLSSNLPKAPQQ